MERDIKSIIILLATQSMINLGEIQDPIQQTQTINLAGARIFIGLLEELKIKTDGNLNEEENKFLDEVLGNLSTIYEKKDKDNTNEN